MDGDYVLDPQNEAQLWGSNKLPVSELNIEEMFRNMNEDLFRTLEMRHDIEEVFAVTDEELFRQLGTLENIKLEEDADSTPILRSHKIPTYGKCMLGVGCTKPATHIRSLKYGKSLLSKKILACEKHASFNMVLLDKWLCRAASYNNGRHRCIKKAKCYIDYRTGPVYCPDHARKFWSNRSYITG